MVIIGEIAYYNVRIWRSNNDGNIYCMLDSSWYTRRIKEGKIKWLIFPEMFTEVNKTYFDFLENEYKKYKG